MFLQRHKLSVMCVVFLGISMTGLALESQRPESDLRNGDQITSSNNPATNNPELREVQQKILDIIGNSSSRVHSLTHVLGMLNTKQGKELGSLLLKGVTLGMQEKNPSQQLIDFWTKVQGRLSPILLESFDDYRDFLKGVDISTLPLVWDQLFKKDELGNSLASLPMGQLVDMLQPTASRYGIDIRAMMNSLIGQGDNNVRDLIGSALSNTDFSTLMNQMINATTSALLPSENSAQTGQKPQAGDARKKGKADKTIRLFRPLVASLLKENEIDLDADAVLEVLSPLFKSDILTQASPWIAMLSGQGGNGGLGNMLANVLGGGGKEGFNQQQLGGLLGGLGALMGTGGKNQMDMTSILSIASMFMGKPSKPKSKSKSKSGNKKEKETNGFDVGSLMNVAGQLLGNNVNLDTILDIASNSLKSGMNKKRPGSVAQSGPSKKARLSKQETERDLPEVQMRITKSKTILNLIEPILLSMKKDKNCNAKIKEAIGLGKVLLFSKISSSLGNVDQIVPLLNSYFGDSEVLKSKGVKLDTLAASFTQAFAKADWGEFLESLKNKDFRQMLIRNIAPNAADVLVLLAEKESQEKMYNSIVPRIQYFFTNYGLVGVTLDNFPERLAPIIGLLGKSWNLPFNPTTLLVPLKGYLKSLKSVALSSLHSLPADASQVEKLLFDTLEHGVAEPLLQVMEAVQTTPDPYCLPQRLCQVNSQFAENGLPASVARIASVALSSDAVLATPDSNLLLHTIHGIGGINADEGCEDFFPGDCTSEEEGEDDEDVEYDPTMDLLYEHQEL
ncbi:uncharacterized protein [Palaemon carinicauda]|uniref:uncharacterized protein n=1 Tax=Palaemon carinicauda TaxID=392227 RepID=UPI0035B57F1F